MKNEQQNEAQAISEPVIEEDHRPPMPMPG